MKRALAFVTSLVLTLLSARIASAQMRVEARAIAEPDTVEVGDSVVYNVQVMVHNGPAPTEMKPGPTPGLTMVGTTGMAPVHMRMNVNGVQNETNGLTASWTLRADKPGTFSLGPAVVMIGGKPRNVGATRVTVVPRGKGAGGPGSRRGGQAVDPFGASPFDPFKGFFGIDDDDERMRRAPAPTTADPKLSMSEPRSPVAFLHATIDKTRAVVGEQVTLAVYLYEDPYAHQGRPGDVHEATANDFVKRTLMEDETRAIGVGTTLVGGKTWTVKLVRKSALFPLKTGHLDIEPMSMTLPQARIGLRESERLAVDVTEPPVDGRPAGYAMGDVGDMSLSATVTPRSVSRDGAIGINVELRGTGNLPAQLSPPVVPGVEWLEPQVHEKVGAMAERWGGTRTFSYVVRVHKEGPVDLGEIRLPYFDPEKRAYSVARSSLGIVNVTAGGPKDAGVEEPEIVLGGMPKERRALEGVRPKSFVTELAWFWAALFGAPVACVLAISAQTLARRARARRENASPSPDRIAKERRAEAEAALAADDGAKAMGAIARAVEAEVLARLGVNVRGSTGAERRREVEAAGASADSAAAITGVLETCEDARFSPDGVTVETARATWTKAKAALDDLDGSAESTRRG